MAKQHRNNKSGSTVLVVTVLVLVLVDCINTCHCFSIDAKSLPILIPSEAGSSTKFDFDTGCVANPVILPPTSTSSEWQCYYYGNAGSWNGGRNCFLPTGSCGLAISRDGLEWTKVPGNQEQGAILTPSSVSGSWDSVHLGVGDVIRVGHDQLHMYYFGANEEEIAMGPSPIIGLRMRIGRATSCDNGRTWIKDDDYLLDYDESEGFFASWPRIVTSTFEGNRPWKMYMYYHSFNGQKWRVFGAESKDGGDSWTRTGLVLEGSEEKNAFDSAGIGTRAVVPWKDGWLMIYEGVDASSKHSFGAAYCSDLTKNEWTKLNDGLPILEPGKGPLGAWTQQVIGTPFVVSMPDASLRLYHCAKDGPDAKMAVGVLVSETGNIEPDCWTACTPS
jgi:hypothetical protein